MLLPNAATVKTTTVVHIKILLNFVLAKILIIPAIAKGINRVPTTVPIVAGKLVLEQQFSLIVSGSTNLTVILSILESANE